MSAVNNPFVVGKYISEEYFCDRVKETQQLLDHMKNGLNTVLYSPRRMGKTGLIRHLFSQREVQEKFYCVFFDAFPTNSLSEFTLWLSKATFAQLGSKKDSLWKSFISAIKSLQLNFSIDGSGSPTLSLSLGEIKSPQQTINEVFSFLDTLDKPVILAMDEFQQVAKFPEKNVEALLRSACQEVRNVTVIFSGSEHHLLNEIFMDVNRPFYQSAVYLSLGAIEKNEYTRFAQEKFKQSGKSIEQSLVETVYDKYAGTTWFVQFTMNNLYSMTPNGSACLEDMLPKALSNIIGFNEESYYQILSSLTVKERAFLFAVLKEGTVKSIYSSSFIQRHFLGTASAVQRSCTVLMEKGILVKEVKGCRIVDYFFAEWLKRRKRALATF